MVKIGRYRTDWGEAVGAVLLLVVLVVLLMLAVVVLFAVTGAL